MFIIALVIIMKYYEVHKNICMKEYLMTHCASYSLGPESHHLLLAKCQGVIGPRMIFKLPPNLFPDSTHS